MTASVVVAGPDVRAGRQAAALRVAAEVVDLLGGGAPGVHVSVPARKTAVDLHVYDPDEARRLAALLRYAARLEVPLSARPFGDSGRAVKVEAVFTRAEVGLVLWAVFTDLDMLASLASDESSADLADREPTPGDLAEIDAEWPLIDAELAVVDAEASLAAGYGGPLATLRLDTAHRRLASVATDFEPAGPGRFRPRRHPLRGAA
ncbi:DUF6284 family protein [Pseudofrankia sp. BMG5.36]|uniref:DUF6284 family protein n=1 Tax=Pseudofrankia sp. BMG5.36 TaxID=1834512 RepID=UPI0008DAB643|nr:DUF6284 family protein [Pseudofrankia sp. BMG5.36]OHV44906.1 hypothetical protein BCD48_23885 [Pseudofrankia sp. BMG5.36]